MIKIYQKDDEIVIKGHAMFAEVGKDIVCASVSSIMTTTVNALIRFDDKSISYEEKDGITIKLLKKTREVNILIENMMALFKELETNYQENIKIYREV